MITVVNYGMGNLRSVEKAFNRLNAQVAITNDPQEIAQATKLVLPGVGHFKSGMDNLRKLNLIEVLNKKVMEEKTPILGICLGMQLFTMHSEEGDTKGLGWIDADTIQFKFDQNKKFKVPHIGWNSMEIKTDLPIFNQVDTTASYYFVHSYYVKCRTEANMVCTTDYGQQFDSCIQRENILGMQFHPEKSHDGGMLLLKNFIELY